MVHPKELRNDIFLIAETMNKCRPDKAIQLAREVMVYKATNNLIGNYEAFARQLRKVQEMFYASNLQEDWKRFIASIVAITQVKRKPNLMRSIRNVIEFCPV